ncbi:MAG: beta-lactamase family protein [Crocinitomicaceae bacterium]|nr:beta-lactamase family protein [Crocinitomicaceae bacterium]
MKCILSLFALLNICTFVNAQNVNPEINELFNTLNQDGKPGCVISIQKKGKTIYYNAFGNQNISSNLRNTKNTIFNLGSVSKQFTAMGIVLLNQKGLLDFNDSIGKYLPQLSKELHPITINQLLHHTSGIRSTPEFFGLAGWTESDTITTEDDFQFLCRQTATNFIPGSQYMYSNSGYVLLAKIIEAVTETTFSSWMKENIFTPLNMNNTFVDASNANSKFNVAKPYIQVGPDSYSIAHNPSHDIGASNIYSNIIDLNTWIRNFDKPIKGWAKNFKKLETTELLSNGYENNYAYGIFLDKDHGNLRIQHTGATPGYLSYMYYYPKEKLSIILLSNLLSREIDAKVNKISSLYLKDKSKVTSTKPKPSKLLSYDKYDSLDFSGRYWNINRNYAREIKFINDTLWYIRDNGSKSQLIKIDRYKYYLDGIPTMVKVTYNQSTQTMVVQDSNSAPEHFKQFDNSSLSVSDLKDYTGNYYSEELQTTYKIELIDNKLRGFHTKFGQFEIDIIRKDLIDWSGFATVKYIRNTAKEITGFYVNLNRVKNVWFKKIE